jgi:hypothetical protein
MRTPNIRFESDALPFRYGPGQVASQAERSGSLESDG